MSTTCIEVPDKFLKSLNRVLAEFDRQQNKWGDQDHTAHEWNAIIGEEFGEAAYEFARVAYGIGQISRSINEQAYLPIDRQTPEQYIAELLQTAACCIQAAVNAETRFLNADGAVPANQLIANKQYVAVLTNPIAAAEYRKVTVGVVYRGKYLHGGGFWFTDDDGNPVHGFASDFSGFVPTE